MVRHLALAGAFSILTLLAWGLVRQPALGEIAGTSARPFVPEASFEVETAAPALVQPVQGTLHHQEGALAGMVVYLSAGHGRIAWEGGSGFQRTAQHDILEDTWTAAFTSDHLIPALERAGAVVLTPRERDRNPESVQIDDRHDAFAATEVLGRERPADTPHGATLLGADGAATWELTAPTDGRFQVYASWLSDEDRDPEATYTVLHPRGAERFRVDQRSHGDQWWPIGTLELAAGEAITVHLSGSGDGLLSAGRVRLGGGTLPVWDDEEEAFVDRPAWEVAAVHHLEHMGAPPWVWADGGPGFGGDAATRGRWADWLHTEEEEALYLSIHTDAGGGTGTSSWVRRRCWTAACPDRDRASESLADEVRGRLVDTIRDRWDPHWVDRGTRAAPFAEVSDAFNPLPAALVEVAFHDNAWDAAFLGQDPFVADTADAIVAGVIRHRVGAESPLPPAAPHLSWRGDTLAWAAGPVSPIDGPAEAWEVRVRTGPIGWTSLGEVSEPTLDLPPEVVAVEVVGLNAAGRGRPAVSERPAPAVADAGAGRH